MFIIILLACYIYYVYALLKENALVWLMFLWAHLEVRMKIFPAPGIILAHLHLEIFATQIPLPGNGHADKIRA